MINLKSDLFESSRIRRVKVGSLGHIFLLVRLKNPRQLKSFCKGLKMQKWILKLHLFNAWSQTCLHVEEWSLREKPLLLPRGAQHFIFQVGPAYDADQSPAQDWVAPLILCILFGQLLQLFLGSAVFFVQVGQGHGMGAHEWVRHRRLRAQAQDQGQEGDGRQGPSPGYGLKKNLRKCIFWVTISVLFQ